MSMVERARPVGLTLALCYALFAAIATGVNLLVQSLVFASVQGPYALLIALIAGTIAGLPPKYLLDKRWIFADRAGGHARKFSLYTAMAGATTLVFWATEAAFDRLDHGGRLHYAGAVIGLALGYWLKYRLDRRFVFGAPP